MTVSLASRGAASRSLSADGDRIGTKVVAEFNNDPAQFVFLISTKAGGVG